MPSSDQAFTRDANRVPITNLGLILKKSITFVAGTTGAVGTTTLFSVSGNVAVNVFALCTADLTSGGSATVEIGIASSTATIADQVTATSIDNNDVYTNSTLAIGAPVVNHYHPIKEDVILTVGTTTITGGSLDIYCTWTPLDPDATVTVA